MPNARQRKLHYTEVGMSSSPRFPLLLAALICLGSARSSAAQPSYGVGYRAAADGLAPLAVTFEARMPPGARVAWDFGDGQTGEGSAPSHTYWQPGRYQVKVIVTGSVHSAAALSVTAGDAGPERAQITLLESGDGATFGAQASRVYAPFTPRWTLDGHPVAGRAALLGGPHLLRLDIGGRSGPLTREVRFVSGPVETSAPFDSEVLRLTNQARAQGWDCALKRFGGKALPPLSRSAVLDVAARAQSSAMALNGYFAHTSPLDGSDVGERAHAAGYPWRSVGENLAGGQRTPQEVVGAWLNSPGHCHNVMGDYAEIGLAYAARGGSPLGRYWTQVFGRR